MPRQTLSRIVIIAAVMTGVFAISNWREVSANGPALIDQNLVVRAAATGFDTPTAFAFIGPNDVLVLEKQTGRVIRVSATGRSTVLDLAVNNGSERGLLGIALHPDFETTRELFLYWTESSTGSDTGVLSETPLLGNRIDRFSWDGANLTQGANVIRLRAIQQDAAQPERGNHDGGVLQIGPDNKLYVFVGDLGRRGQLQNLRCGPADVYNCPPN